MMKGENDMAHWSVNFALIAIISSTVCASAEEGDAKLGRSVFKKCAVCHNVNKQKNKMDRIS